jgi:general secretion pathway protein K
MKNPQSGIALLVVLWILMILTVIAFSLAVLTRGENYGLLAFKEGREKKFMAEAGINRGILEIIYHFVNQNQTVTFSGREIWRLNGTLYKIHMGSDNYQVRVMDETGKISLNGMTDSSGVVLKNLLINQGISPENTDIIIDSILDWKDGDDLHRLNGAESDYYMSLPNPYKARNADFETLEELILVRGMTEEILYGNKGKKGIINFLSLHNSANQINLNAAPPEILAALPGSNAGMVERLMEFRAVKEIYNAEEIKDIIGDSYTLMAPYITFASGAGSAVYGLEATGYKSDPRKGYSVAATIVFDNPSQYRYVYYKSPADIIP